MTRWTFSLDQCHLRKALLRGSSVAIQSTWEAPSAIRNVTTLTFRYVRSAFICQAEPSCARQTAEGEPKQLSRLLHQNFFFFNFTFSSIGTDRIRVYIMSLR